MKKILIISTFFPPAPLTPSERIFSWAKYFKRYGLYPIIVTRAWDEKTSGYEDSAIESGDEIDIQVHEDYTVYYLPYKSSWYEKTSNKLKGNSFKLFNLPLLLLSYLLEPIFLFRLCPFYKTIYKTSKDLIDRDTQIKYSIISGAPFLLFKLGYILSKDYPNLKFFADYRDDWTTSRVCFNPNNSAIMEVVRKYTAIFEKKWLKRYAMFFSVSDNYVQTIKDLIKIDGAVAENGFMADNYLTNSENILYEDFTISYVGYLYPTQPIEIFIDAICKLIDQNPGIKLKVNFIGILNQPEQEQRIKSLIKNYEKHFALLPRIPKKECINIQNKSHLLLLVGHRGIKGTPGSKMYEYLALRKPVLLCPTDHDIMENSLSESKQGLIVENLDECFNTLVSCYKTYSTEHPINKELNDTFINKFNRANIAKSMVSEILQRDSIK